MVDPSAAARGGCLLGAERLVQGSVFGGAGAQVRLDAAIVSAALAGAGNDGYAGAAPENVVRISESDAMQGLFDAEKRLALLIYDALGVELTQAERERVNRRPT